LEYWEIARVHEAWGGWEAFSRSEQRTLNLFYRQSDNALTPRRFGQQVEADDPPPRPGDVIIHVNLLGQLLSLHAVPSLVQDSEEEAAAPDWALLFDAAGLDLATFEEVPPRVRPQLFADARAAWTGTLPGEGERPVRIEAAACRGKPVYFQAIFPYRPEWPDKNEEKPERAELKTQAVYLIALLVLLGSLFITGVLLALRSLALGRGDRKGALRVALSVFALLFLHWLVTGHHVADWEEIAQVSKAISGALTFAVLSWLIYIALEPYVRRYWPEALVGWSRFLAGRLRDPLVGRHLLVGFAAESVYALLTSPLLLWAFATGILGRTPSAALGPLRGGRHALGEILGIPWMVLLISAGSLTLFMLLRIVLRKQWLAVVGYCAIFSVYMGLQYAFFSVADGRPLAALAIGIALGGVGSVIALFVLIRFGVLALIGIVLSEHLLLTYPLTTDISAPYFTSSLIGPIALLLIGIWAFRVSLAGQPLFREPRETSG
jgi:hypothetical protein